MAKVTPVIDRTATTPRERQTAACAALASLALFVAAIAWNQTALGAVASLPASIASAAIVMMLVTAAILRNQYRASGHAAYAFLGTAYTTAAALLLPYGAVVLRMPGSAPFPPGTQGHTGAWLWMAWHGFFLVSIAIYAWSDSFFSRSNVAPEVVRKIIRSYATAMTTIAALCATAIVYFSESLPPMEGTQYSWLFKTLVEQLIAICAVVLVVLVARTRLRQPTHLWLAVIVLCSSFEIAIDGELLKSSFTFGWYAGLVEGLASQAVMLIVLLRRTNEQIVRVVADNETLAEATVRDSMTGLRNRRGFDERLDQALGDARTAGAPVALLALDLDYFKQYNDYFGHVAGDEALRAVAGAIEKITTRSRDIACRIGGEEFAVVLPFTDDAGAQVVADRILAEVLHLGLAHSPAAPQPNVTISIGVAVADIPMSAVDLYECADRALYRAKRQGRNRVSVYTGATASVALAG
ncbi:MAG: GGDEF domain-containing protein [Candidatus Eremiobacteraeota bacterium]|nr:GGDEF domain-containing protein [Candidatus Eremiobacteraeota bacterium]